MHTENPVADQSCYREAVECVRKHLPYFHIVAALAWRDIRDVSLAQPYETLGTLLALV